MNTTVTLFDNGKTRFSLRARKPKAARLVVAFNHLHSNDVNEPGWAEEFLWEAGFDVLSVKARGNSWYQDLSLSDVSAVMAKLDYETVFTYGVSMGAYAAAYFAAAIKPRRAILFSPQYSIDPVIAFWDHRWKDFWIKVRFNHPPLEACPATEYVIFYDPWDPDGRHADEIAAAAGPKNIRRIKVVFSSHDTVAVVNDAGVLSRLVLALFNDSAEVPPLLGTLTRRRKASWRHAYHLFLRALRLSHRILSLQPLMVTGAWEDLDQAMADLPAITLGEDGDVDGAVARINLWFKTYGVGEGAPAAARWARKVAVMTERAPVTQAGPTSGLGGMAMRLGRLFRR